MVTTKRHSFLTRFCIMTPLVIVGVFGVSTLVMQLWNWIIPVISPLTSITYWQAMGLFLLSRILFGGFHFRSHHQAVNRHLSNHSQFRDKLMDMNVEEREQFKNQWKKRCCKPPKI
jgi:Ca2+/H+ antiporter, TMEM165/GDT1 family